MAHEIETHTSETGQRLAAAAFADTAAWHQLGTVTDGAMTVEQAMTAAHLGGWNVRKLPVTAQEPVTDADGAPAGVDTVTCPGYYVATRTSPFSGAAEGLGVVGQDYVPINNEETAGFLQALVDEGGANLRTAGSLLGGRRTFLTMRLPDGVAVGGVDRVEMYLAALNSHDGRTAFQVVVTPVRVVCANTARAALAHNSGIYKVRHTSGATEQIAEARRALELTFAYQDGWAAEVDAMVNTAMSVGQFRVQAKALIRPPGPVTTDRQDTADARRLEHLTGLFTSPLNANIAGTRWAGYNAFTDHHDHHARVATGGEDAATVRARRVLLGGADDAKTAAFRAFAVTA